jgi:hypothetical protein
MTRIQLKCQPDYENYLAVNHAATFNAPTIVLIVLMGIVTLVTILGLALGWLNADTNQLLLYLLPPGTFILFLIYTPINLRRRVKQAAEQAKELSWHLSNSGITINEESESYKHK